MTQPMQKSNAEAVAMPAGDVDFAELIPRLYTECIPNRGGAKLAVVQHATYIPQLEKVNAELFGVSLFTLDGKFFCAGDADLPFCLQSTCKPMVYALVRELLSKDVVHRHVGFEPSGAKYNAHKLNDRGLPHNPLINAGSIVVCSLLTPKENMSTRYEKIRRFIDRLAGHVAPLGFDNSVYLSEQHHADRNRSLAYFIRENNGFPPGTHIEDTLALYFQSCSISATCRIMSVVGASLANQGRCPLTGEQVTSASTARDTLSLMYMCGLYDWSGRFAFEIGLPGKSGVSGALMVSIPNVGGLCVWSPRLDAHGNSVRAIDFMRRFVRAVDCHIFHNAAPASASPIAGDPVLALITAASAGNSAAVARHLLTQSPNVYDYDRRTPLHLACAEGHTAVVKLLLAANADPHFADRWGNTASTEAANAVKCGLATGELLAMLPPVSSADGPDHDLLARSSDAALVMPLDALNLEETSAATGTVFDN